MHANGLFMWWLKEQQELEQRDLDRPRLYAPDLNPAPTYELARRQACDEDEEEKPRVIIIDL